MWLPDAHGKNGHLTVCCHRAKAYYKDGYDKGLCWTTKSKEKKFL